jgi:hypothetical protein
MGAVRSFIRTSLRAGGIKPKNLKDWCGSNRKMLGNPRIVIKTVITPKKKQKK